MPIALLRLNRFCFFWMARGCQMKRRQWYACMHERRGRNGAMIPRLRPRLKRVSQGAGSIKAISAPKLLCRYGSYFECSISSRTLPKAVETRFCVRLGPATIREMRLWGLRTLVLISGDDSGKARLARAFTPGDHMWRPNKNDSFKRKRGGGGGRCSGTVPRAVQGCIQALAS